MPGLYRVRATATGFSTGTVGNIDLAVAKEVTIDVRLAVGSVSESMNVAATAVTLDTESAQVGQVISEKEITDLPLNGRNFTQLLLLGAGLCRIPADNQYSAGRPGFHVYTTARIEHSSSSSITNVSEYA
jgi:hypothetical protein